MGSINISYGSQLWLKGTGAAQTIWQVPVSGIPTGANISSVTLSVSVSTTYNASGNIAIYKGESNVAANRVFYLTAGAYSGQNGDIDLKSYITGNGTFPLLFRKNANSSGSQSNVCFGTPIITITYIEPASTFTLSSASIDAGDTLSVSINRTNDSYTHTVRYSFGNHTTDKINVSTASSYQIPTFWLDTIPNATSGTGSVTVYTYSGSTLLGSNSKSFTINCPSTIVPTIGDITVSIVDNGHWGLCVQGYDKLKISVGTCEAGIGATISSISIYGEGYSSSTNSESAASLTTGIISSYGDAEFVVLVTDSRGSFSTTTVTQYVTPYSAPKIIDTKCYRSDSNQVPQSISGTSVTIGCTYSCANIGSNSASVRVQYDANESGWTEIVGFSCDSGSTVVAMDGELSTLYKYDFKIIVQDSFTSTMTIMTVPSSQVFMRWDKDGNAIGFGCVPQGKKRVELDEWDLIVGGKNVGDALKNVGDALKNVGDALSVLEPVYNQLDNSNFANPVNQRGLTAYNASGSYCIDRWMVASESSLGYAAISSGCIAMRNTSNNYIDLRQIVAGASSLVGKAMTFAVKINGIDTPIILNFTFGTYKEQSYSNGNIVLIHYNSDQVIIRAQNTGENWYGFVWAALYVGTFTAETLPCYVPRGYAAEYHECCRYYYQIPGSSVYAYPGYFASSTLARITINTPMRMRISPTVSVETVSNCNMFSGSGSFTPTDVSVLNRQLDAVCLGFTVSGAPSWTACNARFNTTISLSADL